MYPSTLYVYPSPGERSVVRGTCERGLAPSAARPCAAATGAACRTRRVGALVSRLLTRGSRTANPHRHLRSLSPHTDRDSTPQHSRHSGAGGRRRTRSPRCTPHRLVVAALRTVHTHQCTRSNMSCREQPNTPSPCCTHQAGAGRAARPVFRPSHARRCAPRTPLPALRRRPSRTWCSRRCRAARTRSRACSRRGT